MKGTMADYEIEAITETKIVDVYTYVAKTDDTATTGNVDVEEVAKKVAGNKRVQGAVKKFQDSVPDGTKVSMSVHTAEGVVVPETVVVDKTQPRSDDD